jgi:uncharacterized protein (DUF1499 family)
MRRRAFIQDPPSKLAFWARRVAFFSLASTLIAIIVVRSGLLEMRPALAVVTGALAPAVIAILLAFAAFAVIWKDGLGGLGSAVGAIAVSLGLLGYPGYLAIKAYKLPWIYDITSDPIDPPRYEALARIRPREANPVIYAGLSSAEQQRAAYPDIEPRVEEASPRAAYEAALAVVTKRRWTVLLRRAPEGRRDGQIEAVARTPILGFRDDVVIRIRAIPDGSRIDARSSSRYGSFDFGSNADRIRRLLDDIDEVVGDQKPEPVPVVPPVKKQKAAPKGNQPSARR